MLQEAIKTLNARVALRPRYDNFIGGKWVAPAGGKYFDNISPITGKPICQVARSQAADIELALEGFTMFALNQGEVCTCPSRALVQKSIYDRFMEKAIARVETIKQGNPLEARTMMGAQASNDQLEKVLSYIDIGQKEGATLLTGGGRVELEGE